MLIPFPDTRCYTHPVRASCWFFSLSSSREHARVVRRVRGGPTKAGLKAHQLDKKTHHPRHEQQILPILTQVWHAAQARQAPMSSFYLLHASCCPPAPRWRSLLLTPALSKNDAFKAKSFLVLCCARSREVCYDEPRLCRGSSHQKADRGWSIEQATQSEKEARGDKF